MCLHMCNTHACADNVYIHTHIYIYQKPRGRKDLFNVEGEFFNNSWPQVKCRMKTLNFIHLKNKD